MRFLALFAVAALALLGFGVMSLAAVISRRRAAQAVPSRTEPLIGQTAFVTEAIDPVHGKGRVTVGGQDWAARSNDVVTAGTPVTVIEADGIVLVVEKSGDPQ